MIKWCSYCLHFIEECEPFDDYIISHGVCPACAPKALTFTRADKHAIQGIRTFFMALQKASRSGAVQDWTPVLAESRRLGIPPLDLMMGMLQPLLVEIGGLWAEGKVTVLAEHRFSAMVDALASHLRPEAGARDEVPPRLILVSADGNFHTLGVQMAALYFASLGLPHLTTASGLPTEELLGLVRRYQPEVLGFSVALPQQMAQVEEVAARLADLPFPPPALLVGGPAARQGLDPHPALGIHVCRDLKAMLPYLRQEG